MVEIKLSSSWSKAKEFKKPFYYVVGKGELTEEEAEQHDQEKDGQLLFIHRLDMGDLLKLGIAAEMDFMTKELMSGDGADDKSAQEAVADAVKKADNFAKMERTINSVSLAGVLDPKLYPVPEHENARQKGLFYIDEVPWEDRMELFSVIFETGGLSTFREEQDDGVGNVADVQVVQLPADGPVDIRSSDPEGVLLQ